MKNDTKKAAAKTEAAESKKTLAVDASEAVKKAAPPQSQEAVQALWKKAKLAKAAVEAEVDGITVEQAAALWAEAEAASKPSPEAVEKAEKAKAAKQAAERRERIAKASFEAELIEESVFQAAQAKAEAARQA